MEEEHQNKITRNLVKLVDQLHVSDSLLTCLEATDTLSDEMSEMIMLQGPKRSKARELIKILKKRGPTAFHHFIDALIQTKQSNLANLLDEDYVKEQCLYQRQDTHSPGRTAEQVLRDRQVEMQAGTNPEYHAIQETMEDMNLSDDDDDDRQIQYITEKEFVTSSWGSHDVYKNNSIPRGRAVIINNVKFHKKPRKGSEKDMIMLQKLFKDLHYEVKVHNDLKKEEMCKVIQKESSMDHSAYDSFILVVLSHGKEGAVLGISGQSLFINKDIRDVLSNRKCQSLSGKPKIVIIQACQGDRYDKVDGEEVPNESRDTEFPETLNWESTDADLPGQGNPEVADFFYAIATASDYVSFRSEIKGSAFVRAINKVFRAHVHEWDIDKMFTKVNRVVGKRFAQVQEKTDSQGYTVISRQAPQITKTTGKQFYFFPYRSDRS